MEWFEVIVFLFCGLLVIGSQRREAARKERVKQAYEGLEKFSPEPVHGSRKFATDKELKKAGLI